jgi:hypothetical protein
VFDGESVERFVIARPRADVARMDLLAALAGIVTARD